MDNEINSTPESVSSPQRRQLMKAAAWAAPVVAVVASAPLAAASQSPNWNRTPTGFGTQGNLGTNPTLPHLAGHQSAYLRLVSQTGNVAIPMLTAVYTYSGAWSSASFSDQDGNPFAVNDQFDVDGFIWSVQSVTASSVTLISVTTSIPGSVTRIESPTLQVIGQGDGSGGTASVGVTLTAAGGATGPATGSNSTNVGNIPPVP